MRGWILPESSDGKPRMFYCFNCNTSMSAEHWLKMYFRMFYDDYMKESFKLDVLSKNSSSRRLIL